MKIDISQRESRSRLLLAAGAVLLVGAGLLLVVSDAARGSFTVYALLIGVGLIAYGLGEMVAQRTSPGVLALRSVLYLILLAVAMRQIFIPGSIIGLLIGLIALVACVALVIFGTSDWLRASRRR